ncbi:MAG: thioredoxin family protein [Bacilli bacterium]|nr:thioredoxin family protein [Bacilli bacterium]
MKKLLVISALWCPSCLVMNKYIKNINDDFSNIEVVKLDYDFDEEVKKYNVGKTLPVLILLENNTEVNRLIGEKNYTEIKEFIEEN